MAIGKVMAASMLSGTLAIGLVVFNGDIAIKGVDQLYESKESYKETMASYDEILSQYMAVISKQNATLIKLNALYDDPSLPANQRVKIWKQIEGLEAERDEANRHQEEVRKFIEDGELDESLWFTQGQYNDAGQYLGDVEQLATEFKTDAASYEANWESHEATCEQVINKGMAIMEEADRLLESDQEDEPYWDKTFDSIYATPEGAEATTEN